MSKEWDSAFNEIVNQMEFEYELPPLTAAEVSRAIMGANEAATYLGKVMAVILGDPNALVTVTEDTAEAIRDLIELTDQISSTLSGCECEDCRDCDCTDDNMCDTCTDKYLGDDDEDDD